MTDIAAVRRRILPCAQRNIPSILRFMSHLTTHYELQAGICNTSVTISGKGPMVAKYMFLGVSLDESLRHAYVQNNLRPSLKNDNTLLIAIPDNIKATGHNTKWDH